MTNNIQYTEQIQSIDLHSNTDTSKSTSTEDSFNRVIQHSRLYFFETEAKIDKVNKSKEISNNINNTKNLNPYLADTNYISNLHTESFHNNMIIVPVPKAITRSPIFSNTTNHNSPDQLQIIYNDKLLATFTDEKIIINNERTTPYKISVGRNTHIYNINPITRPITVLTKNPSTSKNRKMEENKDTYKNQVHQVNIITPTQQF